MPTAYDITVPAWIDEEYIDQEALNDDEHEDHEDAVSTIESICQCGCASGSYMPAVTYYTARQVMNEHGDDVLDYLADHYGNLPTPPEDVSWSGLACHYLSAGVEAWAMSAMSQLDPSW